MLVSFSHDVNSCYKCGTQNAEILKNVHLFLMILLNPYHWLSGSLSHVLTATPHGGGDGGGSGCISSSSNGSGST